MVIASSILDRVLVLEMVRVTEAAALASARYMGRGAKDEADAAATDVALGLLLLVGLSISTLIVTLFGPTPEMIASFAWILAISFVVTGMLLLEIASCEREVAGDE
jgi:hypothetical protein